MDFVVSFEQTIQVAEDSWRVSLRTLIADENTTIGDIRQWWLREARIKDGKMDDVKISQPSIKL